MPNGETYKEALRAMQDKRDSITLLVGPPGTGKTRAAIEAALAKEMYIAVFRPPISFGKPMGFLPGELEAKIDPWVCNIKNLLAGLNRSPDVMMKDGTLTFPSFEHAQGDTWSNTFIIIDECENMTMKEFYVLMTRIGERSRMALCGDFNQVSDNQRNSGLPRLTKLMMEHKHGMNVVDFKDAKNYRSHLCGEVVDMFKGVI